MPALSEILILILTLGMSMMIQYLLIDISNKKGIFLDNIAKIQQVHHHPIPRIGGIGIFMSSLFMGYFSPVGMLIMIASIPAFFSGFLEDYSNNVSPLQRLTIMLLAPFIACIILPETALVTLDEIHLMKYVGILFTVLLTTTLINGINFIDGQNGLAASTGIIIFGGIGSIAYQLGSIELIYISSTAVMAILGFILFNFPKAKIFLGDGGAYFIGFIAAIISIYMSQYYAGKISVLTVFALSIFPLLEVTFSVVRKVCFDKISPFQSDKYHLHQLLYRNVGHHNKALPTLLIAPVFLAYTFIITLNFNHPTVLILAMIGFTIVYSSIYYKLRVVDVKRRIKNFNKHSH